MKEIDELINKIMIYNHEQIATFAKRGIVEDLQQLKSSLPTQQDKVVVPEFVAEWYEALIKKGWSHVKIVRKSLHELEMEYVCYTSNVYEWLDNEDNQELLISMKDGYTVEKEQLYWIYDPIADQYLGYDRVTKKVWWLMKQNDGARAELTDAEITTISKQYKAFAVPVEEDE